MTNNNDNDQPRKGMSTKEAKPPVDDCSAAIKELFAGKIVLPVIMDDEGKG